jgi:hypothetical protein
MSYLRSSRGDVLEYDSRHYISLATSATHLHISPFIVVFMYVLLGSSCIYILVLYFPIFYITVTAFLYLPFPPFVRVSLRSHILYLISHY